MNDERLNDLSLPKDARPHSNTNIEWWYFFTFLNGDRGGRYALMASFFQVGEFDFGKGHYLIYTLIDLKTNKRQNFSSIDSKVKLSMLTLYLPLYLLLHPTHDQMWRLYKNLLKGKVPQPHKLLKKAHIKQHPTELIYGTHKLSFKGETEDAFDVHLIENNSEITLEFKPLKPIAFIGGDGKPDDLFYYSFTKNSVHGKIKTDCGTEYVSGTGWFDHQWGRDYSLAKGFGWNWFGLQLRDGRELLLNEMTSNKPDSMMANLVEKNGTLRFTREITMEKVKHWKSLKTNARYPVEWKISIPEFSMEILVAASFPSQEMPVFGPLQAIWEGTCEVTGTEVIPSGKTRAIEGRGFMELVGYAPN